MAANLAATLAGGGSPPHVSVGAKRGEGVGAVGRGEGIAVWAVALLVADES
jgi:2C-methyl-D-erythritol 2,4-cyclodiphosphate synthase